MPLFEGFDRMQVTAGSGEIVNFVKSGSGPLLLLLHGYPQTHTMWHKIAPQAGGGLYRGRVLTCAAMATAASPRAAPTTSTTPSGRRRRTWWTP